MLAKMEGNPWFLAIFLKFCYFHDFLLNLADFSEIMILAKSQDYFTK